MENEKNLSWSDDGINVRKNFIGNIIGFTLFMLFYLFVTLSVMFKASFMFGLVMSIFAVCVLIFEGALAWFSIVKKRLTFVEKMQLMSDKILLTTKEELIELPIDKTKIYQTMNIGWRYFLIPTGSYLRHDNKWYFVPVISINHPVGKKLSELPGNRDWHTWIPIILFIIAAIAFLVYLVWFVIPSIG